jgi:hypothetical protein
MIPPLWHDTPVFFQWLIGPDSPSADEYVRRWFKSKIKQNVMFLLECCGHYTRNDFMLCTKILQNYVFQVIGQA